MELELQILGGPHLSEFRAAESFCAHLAELLQQQFAQIETTIKLVSVPSLQCYGQVAQDVDQLLILESTTPLKVGCNGIDVSISGAVLAIEHKHLTPQDVQVTSQELLVRYNDSKGWRSATDKLRLQCLGARDYLAQLCGLKEFIYGAVWLPNVVLGEDQRSPPNTLGSNFTLEDLAGVLVNSPARKGSRNSGHFGFRGSIDHTTGSLRELREISTLSGINRRRLERFTERYLRDQKFAEYLGERSVVFRGRAGTGKTTFILRAAHDLARRGHRCLFLTFNQALRLDILTLMQTGEEVLPKEAPRVNVLSLHSFLWQVMHELACIDECWEDKPYDEKLLYNLKRLLSADYRPALRSWAATEERKYDFVFVDEGQDLLAEEREALRRVFSDKRLVVADGHDQLLRGGRCIWDPPGSEAHVHVYTMRRSLRMQAGIVRFGNALAGKLGLTDWSIAENRSLPGGQVIVRFGSYTEKLHKKLHAELIDSGNSPGDMLFAVSQQAAMVDGERKYSVYDFVSKLRGWGGRVWNGTERQERKRIKPLRRDEIRLCDYMSIRGLECWTFVAVWLDEFFEYHCANGRVAEDSLTADLDRELQAFQLVLMSITRPINSLVITLRSRESRLGRAVLELAEDEPGIAVME